MQDIIARLTVKNDKYACAIADKIIAESQCIKALAQVGSAKPQYIPRILSCLHEADLSSYKDSMRPLIERDIAETEKACLRICRHGSIR